MLTFFATIVGFLVVVLAMASGLILGGRRLRGSCGGVAGSSCKCSRARQEQCKQEADGELLEQAPIADLSRAANLPSNLVPRGLENPDT